MTHQDQGRNGLVCSHAHDLHNVLRWLLVGVSLSGIAFRAECTWTPETLGFRGPALGVVGRKNARRTVRAPHARLSSIATASNRNPREVTRHSSSCCENGPSPCGHCCAGLSPADDANARRASGRSKVGWCLPSTAAAWTCPAPARTKNVIRPSQSCRARHKSVAASRQRRRQRAGSPRAQGQHAADLADVAVARRIGTALGLADRSFRQQRTRTLCRRCSPRCLRDRC